MTISASKQKKIRRRKAVELIAIRRGVHVGIAKTIYDYMRRARQKYWEGLCK